MEGKMENSNETTKTLIVDKAEEEKENKLVIFENNNTTNTRDEHDKIQVSYPYITPAANEQRTIINQNHLGHIQRNIFMNHSDYYQLPTAIEHLKDPKNYISFQDNELKLQVDQLKSLNEKLIEEKKKFEEEKKELISCEDISIST